MMEFRELTTKADMEAVQDLEYKVWKMEPIPTHQTMTAIKNGGIMLGLFDEGKLVGFSYGFAGFQDGKSYLCSHMMGLDVSYRSRGLGEQLKQRQREVALQKGYSLIKWTFDPLESRNAYLNLTKLRGISAVYLENCYGEMTDTFNAGLPTDRLVVHWHIDQAYVEERISFSRASAVELNYCERGENTFPVNSDRNIDLAERASYAVNVPNNFQALKEQDSELALGWRLAVRCYFQKLFQAGYVVVELHPHKVESTYYFVKKERLKIKSDAYLHD